MNKRISLIKTQRVIDDAGVVGDEFEVLIASNVRAAIQAHDLKNLPPPSDHVTQAGRFYLREFKCWIPTRQIPGIVPLTTWLIKDESTGERYRITAAIDEAGRAHHWLLRIENYEG